ncbi:MAG: YcnI family protein [Candidatus Saccharimonas sp.]
MKRLLMSVVAASIVALTLPTMAFAHVVVTPKQAEVGARTTFTVSVPNERNVAVSSLKLNIPSGLQSVQPNVTAGWDISIVKDNDGNVRSITWSGSIPAGQRADLVLKAQTPAKASELNWLAYQTYSDGTVVSWDQDLQASTSDSENSTSGPYSITSVIDDLSADKSSDEPADNPSLITLALVFSVAALILSLAGLFIRRRK